MLFQRILITGANGLLGQHLVHRLGQVAGNDVLATGLQDSPRFTGGSCGYTPLDITDSEQLRVVFEDFTPDVVINSAAMTAVDACESDRDACWKINVDAVESLVRLCRVHGTRLVQLSTDFVFDGLAGPYTENDRPHPISYYGKSKLAAENHVRSAGLTNWAIARTVLVYGSAENMSRSNIVLWLVDKLSRGETVHMVTDHIRTPTYVVDLADGIERMVRFRKSGVYNLSGGDLMSVYDMAVETARVFGYSPELVQPTDSSAFQQAAPRPPRSGFIILKAQSELGWQPRTLPQGLAHLGVTLGRPTYA